MKRMVIKKIVYLVLLMMIFSSIPTELFIQLSIAVDNSDDTNEEMLITDNIRSNVTYGPYKGIDENQKHAYEPFKEKEKGKKIQINNNNFKKDKILIKLNESKGFSSQTLNDLYTSGIVNIKPLINIDLNKFSSQKLNDNLKDLTKWYKADLAEGKSVSEVIEKIKDNPNVVQAEPDYIANLTEVSIPNSSTDPDYDKQWHLEKTGVIDAWNHLEQQGLEPGGSSDIVVAVIDTGVDYTHPDLVGNMWINSREIPNNNIDDDNNGYIDDIHGATTVGNQFGGHSGDPMDDHGHGTHVAGIVAASGNNNIGGVGVAYNTKIMAIKAGQSSGTFAYSDIVEAILYAYDKGADIINMSFGGYARSIAMDDALEEAFSTSVLVAAAGNDSYHNDPRVKVNGRFGRPMYPAANPWVLGVMAQNPEPDDAGDNLACFSNWDYESRDSYEYHVLAPGVDIYSTIPNDKYKAWDGTSMAAPIVSGIAALLRTKFSDKNMYSSRFIMGQLSSTGEVVKGRTYDMSKKPTFYYESNAYNALTQLPKPNLSYLEHYIFDTKLVSEDNDADGVVDAGETFDIGLIIRNHWGKADNVEVKIDTKSGVGLEDPYVTIINDTVNYGAVGTFNTDDNGLIIEDDMVIGVENPFTIKVDKSAPNDHVIPINITITARNGLDDTDPATYVFPMKRIINVVVRSGRVVPNLITEDMTLTKDTYWIIPNATTVEEGATLTIEPGTQIQFWSSEPEDPYADKPMAYLRVKGNLVANGTAEEPIEMFTGAFWEGYEVKIYSTEQIYYMGTEHDLGDYVGNASISYTRIMNPNIAVQEIDHCYFSQDKIDIYYKRYLRQGVVETSYHSGPVVYGDMITNSIFYKLGYGTSEYRQLRVKGNIKGNLFDSCTYYFNEKYAEDNTLLNNYNPFVNQYGSRFFYPSKGMNFGLEMNIETTFKSIFPVKNKDNGSTYLMVIPQIEHASTYEKMKYVQQYANYLGGHIVTINDQDENDFLTSYVNSYPRNRTLFRETYPNIDYDRLFNYDYFIGLNDFEEEGNFRWINGEESAYTNWYSDQPDNMYAGRESASLVKFDNIGKWSDAVPIYYSLPFIIEIPEDQNNANHIWTDEELEVKRKEFIRSGEIRTIKNNAILNRWWDPDVKHWMRFIAKDNGDYIHNLSYNYWGITNEELINKALVDFNDYQTMADILIDPILNEAPETAYPFVTQVYVKNSSGDISNEVGAEEIEVNITFNRDMDTEIQPKVTFGPDLPSTDFTVDPLNNGWISARHWVGTFDITPVTGDGYQFFRVAGAVAADDPWLVTGKDSERFRFEIVTSGAEAMNLQATGGDGKVILSWTQDDFDLLAGYNMYRSEFINGGYTKINEGIIPSDVNEYIDENVTPGKVYYYKFTIAKLDFSSDENFSNESDFSNIASAAAFDNIAPVINHEPIQYATVGLPLQIYADVTDNVSVEKVEIYFKNSNDNTYTVKEMNNSSNNKYTATIEGSLVSAPGLDYYIVATDGTSVVEHGKYMLPHSININDGPKITAISPNEGPVEGGTEVIITGTNFKDGASVIFDGVVASNVTVESESRITAVTPAHFPSTVDVTVVNPDSFSDISLRAFTYINDDAEVIINNHIGNVGDILKVPVKIIEAKGLTAVDLTITYDKDVLKVIDIKKGLLTSDFELYDNSTTPGEIKISMPSQLSYSGTGDLVVIEFEVLETDKKTSSINLDEVTLNGEINENTTNGTFTLSDTSRVEGNIYYYNSSRIIQNVNLELKGNKTYTVNSNETGKYSINGIVKGDYTLTPTKKDEITDITAYDAALISKHSAGLQDLNNNQKLAADVDNNGKINAMDASYVLRKSVGLIDGPFPGQGKTWVFTPENKELSINNNLTDINFTGILIGDVSGNWGGNQEVATLKKSKEVTDQSISQDVIGLDTVRVEPGNKVTIPVNYKSKDLLAVNLTLSYDDKLLLNPEIKINEKLNDINIMINNSTPGKLIIGLYGTQNISGEGELFNITFDTANNPGNEVIINIDEVNINERYNIKKQFGKVIIAKKGDINLDNNVNIDDINELKEKYKTKDKIFDLNGDGKIDIFDIVIISKEMK